MKIEWLAEILISSGREFHKLEALRRKKLLVKDFLKSGIWTFWLWRKAYGTNSLNDLKELAGKGQGTI